MGCLSGFSPSTILHCHPQQRQEHCKFNSSLKASSSSSSPSSSPSCTELILRRRASCWNLGHKRRDLLVSCGRLDHGNSISSSSFVREKNGFLTSSSWWRQHEVRMRMRTAIGFEEASGLQEEDKTEEPMITEVKLNMPEKPGCLFQAFGWNSHLRQDGKTFYERMTELAPDLKATGFTHILFPPCTRAADPQGFMPQDFYNLDSAYGTEDQLKTALATLHKYEMHIILDVVLHQFVDSDRACQAAWNKAGTILDSEIDLGDWIGAGDFESDDDVPENGAVNLTERNIIDHSHPVFQNDVKGWLLWLKQDVGFDGWCFDYAKTYDPKIFQIYGEETTPAIAVGDVWHPMRYNGTMLEYNQDDHRQQLCDWVNVAGGTARVFDYTTKGILQKAVEATEYWRLCDTAGKPSGLIGWWPEMAITFLDNHSTGSEPRLWPYPTWGIELGYVYILTHPGIPCIFAEDFQDPSLQRHIKSLLAIRKKWDISPDSRIQIKRCDADLYIAKIGHHLESADFNGVYVKFGPSFDLRGFAPPANYEVALSGHDYCVWVVSEEVEEGLE